MPQAGPHELARVVGVRLVEPHHARRPQPQQRRRVVQGGVGRLPHLAGRVAEAEGALEGDELGADLVDVAPLGVVEALREEMDTGGVWSMRWTILNISYVFLSIWFSAPND